MKEQTAVEWLFEELYNKDIINDYTIRVFEEAKQMEKERIIESYCQGCFDISKDDGIVPRETAEDYYNETFK
jgi:hypothetical protein